MKETKKQILAGCLAAVLLLCTIGSTAAAVATMRSVGEMKTVMKDRDQEENGPTQEDDVTIASQYRIQSTRKISDAYLSGDKSGLSDREKEVLDLASGVLEEIVTDGMSDYEKELAVYRWMTTKLRNDTGLLTVIPSSGADSDNPYGVLKYHNAVCVGYATTFRLLMQMLNIDCMVVHNSERLHSWNLVKLEDQWYHVDIYMDADTGNYANFNLNDTMASRGHDWDRSFFPAAVGVRYNYSYQNRTELGDVYDLAAAVKKAVDEKQGALSFCFQTPLTERQAQIGESILNQVQERLYGLPDTNSVSLSWSWNAIREGEFFLSVQLSGFEKEKPDGSLTEEEQQRAMEAVDAAFGDSMDDMLWGGMDDAKG